MWKCPQCGVGLLELESETLRDYETPETTEAKKSEEWEPSWATYHFMAAFRCSHKRCSQTITAVGIAKTEEFEYDLEDGEPIAKFYITYYPHFFSVPMRIFDLPSTCPNPVSDEIAKSFNVFFADPSAAANHVRTAIEELLTYLKIKRYDRIDGELHRISLHRRITLFKDSDDAIAEKLLAIKWLGNAASHPGGLTKDNVLDAYEILDSALSSLFDTTLKKLDRLVKTVNRQKGPSRGGKTA